MLLILLEILNKQECNSNKCLMDGLNKLTFLPFLIYTSTDTGGTRKKPLIITKYGAEIVVLLALHISIFFYTTILLNCSITH